jgi:hypothetical protein
MAGHLWRLHQSQNQMFGRNSDKQSNLFESMPVPDTDKCEIRDQYIWGIELIFGLRNFSILKLKLSEEITYW